MRRAFRGWLRLRGSPGVGGWERVCVRGHRERGGKMIGEVGYVILFGPVSRVGDSVEGSTVGHEVKYQGMNLETDRIPVGVRTTL